MGAFDWPIRKNNNHTTDAPKLKYYLAFPFNGLASYINKKNGTLVKDMWWEGNLWKMTSFGSFPWKSVK